MKYICNLKTEIENLILRCRVSKSIKRAKSIKRHLELKEELN